MDSVQDVIASIYEEIDANRNNPEKKSELYFSMVFIKKEEGNNDIYVEIKKFIENYFISVDARRFLYDHLNCEKIKSCVRLLTDDEQISIYNFLKKNCTKYHFENEWKLFEIEFFDLKKSIIKKRRYWYFNPKMVLKYIYFASIHSFVNLSSILFLLFFIDFITLLPIAKNIGWTPLFEISYQKVSNNFLINHLLNVLIGLFEIDSDFKVVPLNVLGTLLLVFGKICKIIFIIKYASDNLIKKIQIDE